MNSVKVSVGYIVVRVSVWIRLYKRLENKDKSVSSQSPHKERKVNVCVCVCVESRPHAKPPPSLASPPGREH